jgi:anti-sigma factor RsiW
MTPSWDCTEARLSLGVYVLGAIDPAERALVDAHLMTCQECRDELAGLAGLPALLARVNPDEISRICADDAVGSDAVGSSVPAAVAIGVRPGTDTEDRPPGELIGTVLDLAEARRRRGRWRLAAAAAAVVAISGGLAGGLSSISTTKVIKVPLSPGTSQWETVQAVSKISGASASVAYAHEQWGDAYAVLVDHIQVGTTCELWIVHPDGTRTLAGSWTTAPDEGKVWYSGSTAASDKAISSFQITSGHKVLLTAKPL